MKTGYQNSRFAHLGHDQATLPIKTCLLKNFRKKAISIGRVNTDAPLNDEAYNIIVDDVFDGNEMLFDRDGKFEDITIGKMINWPKYSVQFVRF
ncbi:cytosolic purine 5-nucleotidase [Iris pallida]|uniref:Cytosolic purine 5-nucleotidase n=1 Tax=Iris pallida TaxID=29817 RepID=A0AAX6GGP4_IRIPA|nr:cytosolic purine 5-nucleotidase [Iris pallida]